MKALSCVRSLKRVGPIADGMGRIVGFELDSGALSVLP